MFRNLLLIGQTICFCLITFYSIQAFLHRGEGEIAAYSRLYVYAMLFVPYFILIILSSFFRINWTVTATNYVFFITILWLALRSVG